jgi:hypothetical protein
MHPSRGRRSQTVRAVSSPLPLGGQAASRSFPQGFDRRQRPANCCLGRLEGGSVVVNVPSVARMFRDFGGR